MSSPEMAQQASPLYKSRLFGSVYEYSRQSSQASNVPSWYSGGSVGVVARYTPGLNYSVWVPGIPIPKDFYLVPGQGFWIWVTASGTLSYTA